jgi:D-sedoheptulose 7-phosphate isomerase
MKWLTTRERDPRKPLRFDSPKAPPAYGIAWYRAEQWARLREVSADRDSLEPTHAEWLSNATRRSGEMAQTGITLRRVDVDVDRMVAWLESRGLQVNADTRSLYVEHALREEGEAAGAGREPRAEIAAPPNVDAVAGASPATGDGAAASKTAPQLDAYFADRLTLVERLRSSMIADIRRAAVLFVDTIKDGGTIYFFGNGGSAADAQHLSTELVERLMFDRRGFRAHALTTNTSLLTATANDRGYDDVFARQIEALGRPGDLLVAISTSGKSPSVIRALEAGRRLGIARLGLSGRGGGRMPPLCDLCLIIPSDDTQQIQEAHIMIGHYLCMTVEAELAR